MLGIFDQKVSLLPNVLYAYSPSHVIYPDAMMVVLPLSFWEFGELGVALVLALLR